MVEKSDYMFKKKKQADRDDVEGQYIISFLDFIAAIVIYI